MQGLDPDHVVYLGTFSKILLPSLRLGYAIVPPRLVEAFCGARTLLDRHPPSADQHVLAAFIAEGHLDRHIRRIRGVYGECRSQLSQLLQDVLPSNLAWLQPSDQGMHLVLWLAPGIMIKPFPFKLPEPAWLCVLCLACTPKAAGAPV